MRHPRFLFSPPVGDDHEQYCLRGDTLRRIPKSDWDRLLRLCNEWNALYKMPKVYLEVDDPNSSATGRVVCEQWLNLESGLHQELVSQLTSSFFLLGLAVFGFMALARTAVRHARPGRPRAPSPPISRSSRSF